MVKRKGFHDPQRLGDLGSAILLSQYAEKNKSISSQMLDPAKTSNPKFDPRIQRTTGAGGVGNKAKLLRGRIVQYRDEFYPIDEEVGIKRRSVDFLYNPEQIGVRYSFSPDAYPSESQQSLFPVPVLGATGQTLSWQLYFNRMYEVASDPESTGVLQDVQAMEYLLGTKDGRSQSMVEVFVIFGVTPKQGKTFGYMGFISDFNVTYTHFSHRMIPTVATCEVGMVRRWLGTGVNDGSSVEGTAGNSSGQTGGWGSSGGASAGPRVQDPIGGGGGIPIS